MANKNPSRTILLGNPKNQASGKWQKSQMEMFTLPYLNWYWLNLRRFGAAMKGWGFCKKLSFHSGWKTVWIQYLICCSEVGGVCVLIFNLLCAYLKHMYWIAMLHKMLSVLERAGVDQQCLQRLTNYKWTALKHPVSFYLSLKKLQD